MPQRLVVGMITQDSPGKANIADDIHSRIAQLRHAINDFMTFGAAAVPAPVPGAIPPPPVPNATLRIFLAPEYFFRKRFGHSKDAGITTAYTKDEMIRIRAAMQAMSTRHPNFLLIGGTILWHDDTGGGVFVRHSAFVFHSGALLLHYEKKNDCGELQDFETVPKQPHVFKRGTTLGTFVADGLNCGIETCVDHELGQLNADNVSDLDLHIIVANTVSLRRRNVCANPLGYALLANAGNYGSVVSRDPFDIGAMVQIGTPNCVVQKNGARGHFVLPWPAVPDAAVRGLKVV